MEPFYPKRAEIPINGRWCPAARPRATSPSRTAEPSFVSTSKPTRCFCMAPTSSRGGLFSQWLQRHPEAGSSHTRSILCTGGPGVIRKEAWSFYRTISGVRLCWQLEEPEGPKGSADCMFLEAARGGSTRRTRQLSSRVKLLSAINLKALCGSLGPLGSSSSKHRRTPELVL